jgi:hypothetical protein
MSLVLLLALAGDVELVRDGKALLPIVEGSVAAPVRDLRAVLREMSGADFETARAGPGLHVGLFADFGLPAEDVGAEGFVLRSDARSVFLLAKEPSGVQHAVSTFLQRLGCRWFFPGKTWTVIPRRTAIAGSWSERQVPSFPAQRLLWYGFGGCKTSLDELEDWKRHNRMGGPVAVGIGHTWHGLDPEKDFAAHPEWFALVGGKRQASKPCYSHPDVVARAVEHALREAASGKAMVSMTPPDGLGYCECGRCRSVFQGGAPFQAHSTAFAKRPDGVLVNATSETLFRMVNEVAQAVAAKHPQTLVGCYAYSAYSHPPSFPLHANVFVQTTTAFRRTPLSLDEQLRTWGERAGQVGIREYWSVYPWDWDGPHPTAVDPLRLQKTLRSFRENKVTSVNAEACNNWGPRGLGYYVGARLLWDADADVRAIVRDFHEQAFGPAAEAMRRYYARWYAPLEARAGGELDDRKPDALAKADLAGAWGDLDEAARLVRDLPGPRERVDQLRMYLHYLALRLRLDEAKGDAAILEAIRAETVFGGRLASTNMIHARPLLGKAFLRRFKKHEKLLAGVPEAQEGKGGWRQVGEPPGRDELDRLWADDRAFLGVP